VPALQDRRLKEGKLKNWQRRYREEVDERPIASDQGLDNQGEFILFVTF
jgi:hypothetical protein